MRDLQVQLSAAQAKVEAMELDLRDGRGQLTARRERREGGDAGLQAEMRRVVEMRAMLDAAQGRAVRRPAQHSSPSSTALRGASEGDQELAEALAAKVTHLRQTYEQTLARLTDQEAKALVLSQSLEESRREAGLLRGRSDGLSTELVEARSNLSGRAQARRGSWRWPTSASSRNARGRWRSSSTTRRTTTSVFRNDAGGAAETPSTQDEDESALADRLSEQEVKRSTAETELAREKRRAEDLAGQLHALQSRITELTLDRDHLKVEHDRLVETQSSEQERLNGALSTATQATIEAEGRQRLALARIAALENELAAAADPSAPTVAAPARRAPPACPRRPRSSSRSPLPPSSRSCAPTGERLAAELQEARGAHQAAPALLSDAKAAAAAASQKAAANDTTAARDAAGEEARRGRARPQERRDPEREPARALRRDRGRVRAPAPASRNRPPPSTARRCSPRATASLRSSRPGRGPRSATSPSCACSPRRSAPSARSSGPRWSPPPPMRSPSAPMPPPSAPSSTASRPSSTRRASAFKDLAVQAGGARGRRRGEPGEAARSWRASASTRSQAERSQLLAELDRLRSEVVTFTQQRDGAGSADALKAALAKLQEAKGAQDDAQCASSPRWRPASGLSAQVAALSAAASSTAEQDAEVQSRLAVATSRAQTAEELLSSAREQQRATAAALDSATLSGARLEAERAGLIKEIARVRAELDQVRTAATVREGSPMSAALTDFRHRRAPARARARPRVRQPPRARARGWRHRTAGRTPERRTHPHSLDHR